LGDGRGGFQTHVDYPTGPEPSSIAVGDFNGDGELDLAVADQNCPNGITCGPGSVSILLGKGDGTFEPSVDYSTGSTGSGTYSVAVGDFNRDGKLDLVVANQASNNISVLLGNGDGTFQAAVNYGTGSGTGPTSVAVGDFNGDGKLDLAVANVGCGTPCGNVAVLLGNGDGTFQAAVNYNAGAQPLSIAVGDFNLDGKLDLAVANVSSYNVSVLLGNGDGTFQTAANYSTNGDAFSVVVADLNGDGKPDLIAVSGSVTVFLGNGNGTFQRGVNYGAGSDLLSVAMGDFNDDGRLDLVVTHYGTDSTLPPTGGGTTVSVLLQTPIVSLSKTNLTFADQLVETSSPPQMVTLSNTSGLTLNISSIAVTGTDPNDFSQTNTCGSSVPPQGSCTITVTFTPTEIGPRTASVTITDNAADSPQQIALSGTGVVSGPNATLSPTSLTFPTQLVGTTSPAQSVTLSDYGTATLSISSISIKGADPGDFAQTNNCGSSLAPGASCTMNITFKPKQGGSRTATLSVADNAPGSPQTASLSGTGTVVKLVPTSLYFSCHDEPKTCPPPPQTVTLTNVGSTTLNITSITATPNPPFSETNNCDSSVGAGQSCTITVTFNSSTRGSFSGAVSISDNGGGSPQQVSLSAKHTKTTPIGLAVRSALAATRTAAVASPTGPNPVGTRVMDLVDTERDDPFLADGTKRELLVRFWYPASLGQGCEPAEYTSPTVWSYFSQLAAMPLPEVRTNSCLNSPITGGAHPVVVFTHGYTGTFTDYTFIFEDLASRGYVVASVNHTCEATAVHFPDGRFVESVFGSHLAGDTLRSDEQALSFAVSVRLRDLKFVVNELQRLNGEAGSPFTGKLDTSRLAVAGHSLGGMTALPAVLQDTRFKAGILIDGWPDSLTTPTKTPVLILAAGHERWSDGERSLWNNLRGPRLAVNLRGAEHLTPSDALWLARGCDQDGRHGPG